MRQAYLVDLACTPLLSPLTGLDPVSLLADLARNVTEPSGVRPTDVYELVVGCRSAGDSDELVARWNSSQLLGGNVPGYAVHRGHASGLQAIALAAVGVMAGQQDVVVAAGASWAPDDDGSIQVLGDPELASTRRRGYGNESIERACHALAAGELSAFGLATDAAVNVPDVPSSPSLVTATATALIVSDRFAHRSGVTPLGRILRAATAVGYGGRAEGMVEAAIRLLLNETINVGEVDIWEVYDGDVDALLDTVSALGLEPERVNVMGGSIPFGDAAAASSVRSTAIALCGLARRDLRTCVVLAPGPADTGVAVLIERT